jgi:hypothetical protein
LSQISGSRPRATYSSSARQSLIDRSVGGCSLLDASSQMYPARGRGARSLDRSPARVGISRTRSSLGGDSGSRHVLSARSRGLAGHHSRAFDRRSGAGDRMRQRRQSRSRANHRSSARNCGSPGDRRDAMARRSASHAESTIISLAGGGLGLLLATWTMESASIHSGCRTSQASGDQSYSISPGLACLRIHVVSRAGASVLLGLAPALQSSSPRIAASLHDDGALIGLRLRRDRCAARWWSCKSPSV